MDDAVCIKGRIMLYELPHLPQLERQVVLQRVQESNGKSMAETIAILDMSFDEQGRLNDFRTKSQRGS